MHDELQSGTKTFRFPVARALHPGDRELTKGTDCIRCRRRLQWWLARPERRCSPRRDPRWLSGIASAAWKEIEWAKCGSVLSCCLPVEGCQLDTHRVAVTWVGTYSICTQLEAIPIASRCQDGTAAQNARSH